jgi:anti-sigma B factor antagonist
MPKSFDIEVATDGRDVVAHLAGELDLSVRADVVAQVTGVLSADPPPTEPVNRLVIDLGEVTFCDSSGLGALLDIRRAAGDAEVPMVLRAVPPPVARLLELTDVDGWLARE